MKARYQNQANTQKLSALTSRMEASVYIAFVLGKLLKRKRRNNNKYDLKIIFILLKYKTSM